MKIYKTTCKYVYENKRKQNQTLKVAEKDQNDFIYLFG